ncbi:MAG: ribosome maturation factor RimM [Bacteroidia bacterium]
MPTPPELSLIGRISRKHGFKGALVLDIDQAEALPLLKKGNFLFVVDNEKGVPFLMEDVYGHQPIVELRLIDSEEKANWCLGRRVGLDRSQFKSRQKSSSELVGLWVLDAQSQRIGSIASVDQYPGGPMLNIQGPGTSVLIPWVEEWVLGYDPKKKELSLDLPEGLLNIDEIESENDAQE